MSSFGFLPFPGFINAMEMWIYNEWHTTHRLKRILSLPVNETGSGRQDLPAGIVINFTTSEQSLLAVGNSRIDAQLITGHNVPHYAGYTSKAISTFERNRADFRSKNRRLLSSGPANPNDDPDIQTHIWFDEKRQRVYVHIGIVTLKTPIDVKSYAVVPALDLMREYFGPPVPLWSLNEIKNAAKRKGPLP